MVVQSVALPNVAGGSRDHEQPIVPAESASARVEVGRSLQATLLVPLLVASQAVWLGLLGYGAARVLF